jgi:hypothetical protein
MRKLWLVTLFILIASWAQARQTIYWQEYGSAAIGPVIDNETDKKLLLNLHNDANITLVLACVEQLELTASVEFVKLLFKLDEQQLNIQKYKLQGFARITQPVGLINAQEYNNSQLAILTKKYPADNPALAVFYLTITDFLTLQEEPAVHQLITIQYQGENYNYVSAGIVIAQNFYDKYMKLPNNHLQAYTMAYALEKAYTLSFPHWQLSVTNYKLTKLTHLKTAINQ